MEHLLNKKVKDIQISGIRRFSNLVAGYPNAISLTIGQPDFPTPEHIREAGKRAIDQSKTTYTHNAGLLELRKAASQFLEKKYQLSYNPENEIIVTNGASEAIDICFRTILEPGSEVILPGPVYPGYEPIIRLCGADPIYLDTTTNGFKVNAEMIRRKLTQKTRCVILPYPSNPTGSVMDKGTLADIVDLLRDRDIFILSDEIYSELIYGQGHLSIAAWAEMREKTIVINGLSKSHSMTGWRIGFTFAPSYITQQMIKVHQYNVTCASSISQYAALEALTEGMDDAEGMKEEYVKRRDYVFDRLVSMGLDVIKPEGAFYILPSIKPFDLSSFEFASKLLEQEQLAVVPGSAFSDLGEGYIRISYAYSMDILKEGMDRLERFIAEWKRP